ncbi:MAG: ABC transporter permease [Chloroflexi bacterium]|nr:ABC transporter permease [Chloroflexota bacterium]
MIGLGIRLALSGGRGAIVGLGLTSLAVAIGTAVLLFALSFAPALADRDARTAWRDNLRPTTDAVDATLVLRIEDRVDDQLLTRIHVAPDGDPAAAPVPAGLPSLPEVGEAYVSPALARLMGDLPSDQLADRIGRVAGSVPDAYLASPDELVAVIGTEPEVLRAREPYAVTAFETDALALELPLIGVLILALAAIGALAPVAVFVATATRLSAARREMRLAALRLVGATPGQIARLAVVEALVVTSIGSLAGIVLFLVSRPLVARIPLDATTWWISSISPPMAAAVVMLLAVQVVGAIAALASMRRLVITPLGVQRRAAPSRPAAWRIIPLGLSLAALAASVALFRDPGLSEVERVGMIGGAFAAVIGAIAFAGPWLTVVVGSVLHRVARGAAALLAARRLSDEPRGSFGAIAGVIMAVFVASAFFTFTAFARLQAGSDVDPLLREGGIMAYPTGGSSLPSGIAETVGELDGVIMAVEVRSVALLEDGEFATDYGWVASCPDLVEVLGLVGASCAADGVNLLGSADLGGTYDVIPATAPSAGTAPRLGVEIRPDPSRALLELPADTRAYVPAFLLDPSAFAEPAGVERLPADVLYVGTDGSAAVGERVRTAVVAAAPDATVRLESERVAADSQFAEIGRIVGLGLIGTLTLAGCSLAVAVTTATLERRRQFVLLRSAGMAVGTLRSMILLQAGVPLAAVAIASALLGALVGSGILFVTSGVLVLPDATVVIVIGLSIAVAMAVVAMTLPPLERMTRPTSLRHE